MVYPRDWTIQLGNQVDFTESCFGTFHNWSHLSYIPLPRSKIAQRRMLILIIVFIIAGRLLGQSYERMAFA